MDATEPDADDASFDALADQLLRLYAVLAPALKRSLESFQGEDHALMLLAGRREGMTASALAHAMGITSGRTSNILRQLEGKGLIDRARDDGDLRSVRIRTTERGTLRAQERVDQQREALIRTLRSLGHQDAAEMTRLAGRLAELQRNEAESGDNQAM